jgi:hypothetical protein
MNIEDIGELKGARVMVNHDDQTVIIASRDLTPIKFSIDHPYIQGTKIEEAARAALSANQRGVEK